MSTRELALDWHVNLPHIPIGERFSDLVDWLNGNVGPLFDFIQNVGGGAVDGLSSGLTWFPPLILVVLLSLLALAVRGWKFGLFSLIALAFVDVLQQWETAMQSLAQIIIASVVALVLAIPIGIIAAEVGWAQRIVRPVLDFMQTMPAFVYLIPAVTFFSIGAVPGVVATVVFAMPPGVRLTELGIRQVDREVVEAGEAFGATRWAILTRTKIPLALPTIMTGVNQVIMLALSMVVIAGMVGAPGLGKVVFGAIGQLDIATGFEGGLAVVVLAMYLDRLTSALGERAGRIGRPKKRRESPGSRAKASESDVQKATEIEAGVSA